MTIAKKPIYVYDTRTMMNEPLFVVYDMTHVDVVLNALTGVPTRDPKRETRPEWAYVTHVREHKNVGPADPYHTK